MDFSSLAPPTRVPPSLVLLCTQAVSTCPSSPSPGATTHLPGHGPPLPEPGIHRSVPSSGVELPHEGQLGEGQLAGGHGLPRVHWHLPHVDFVAGFMLKGAERRRHSGTGLPNSWAVHRHTQSWMPGPPGELPLHMRMFQNPRPKAKAPSLRDLV